MISLEQIQFGYSKKKLFNDLSLNLKQGHVCGLLGKNGAGKSTLLQIISGLRFPQKGCVEVLNRNACLRDEEVLQELYYLVEEPYIPHLKIKEYEKAYSSFYPHYNHEQFKELLVEFEIENDNAYMDKMSLGQKKKVLIAFAIACNTAILLMDEPTNGLDIPAKSVFRRIMAQCSSEERLTVISTHQVRDLYSLIDHVSILDHGIMLMDADLDEITDKLLFCLKDEKVATGDVLHNEESNKTTGEVFHSEKDDRTTGDVLHNEENNKTTGEVLYSEESARGTWQVCENIHHLPSSVDLELLFNAAISNKTKFSQIFKKQ